MKKILSWMMLCLGVSTIFFPFSISCKTHAFSPSIPGQPLIFHRTKPSPSPFDKKKFKKLLFERRKEILKPFHVTSSANYPFPVHNIYSSGIIKPNVDQDEMDEVIKALYLEWKERYVVTPPSLLNISYIFYNQDGTSIPKNAVCVSEGQGYGMIIAAFMAGFDPDAQVLFDNLYRYYRAFPSMITPSLMGWQQVLVEDEIIYAPGGGSNSATDGDMDIAFALLLADKQWGSQSGEGAINYLSQAQEVMTGILTKDVNAQISVLKLGNWVKNNDVKFGKATRPSDFMLNHLRNFSASSENSDWDLVMNKTYSIINELFTNYSPTTGLLPDFSENISGSYIPARASFLEREVDGSYSWNSCRTPWRIALDYILSGDDRALDQLTQLNSWIRSKTKNKPANIKSGYQLDGSALVTYGNLAFSTPFAVSAMIDASNQEWLNKLWTFTSSRPTNEVNYFDNTLRLLCLIAVSGNWWTPINLPPSN